MSKSSLQFSGGDRMLAALPRREFERLAPRLEAVHLARGKTVYETGNAARYAYFINKGTISLLSTTDDE